VPGAEAENPSASANRGIGWALDFLLERMGWLKTKSLKPCSCPAGAYATRVPQVPVESAQNKSSSQPLFLLFRLACAICLPGSHLCVHVSLVGDVLIADAEEMISRNCFNNNSETELTMPLPA
jgi:hypothetical protein